MRLAFLHVLDAATLFPDATLVTAVVHCAGTAAAAVAVAKSTTNRSPVRLICLVKPRQEQRSLPDCYLLYPVN